MRKYAMIIYMMLMVTIISGCATYADNQVDVTYPILNEDVVKDTNLYRFEIETVVEDLEEVWSEERESAAIVSGGASWIYAKTQDGVRGTKTTNYMLTYNKKDELLSRIEIPGEQVVVATTPTLYESGQRAKGGAYYTARAITRYGADCVGCNLGADGRTGTASGIGVGTSEVRQQDGSWQTGVTYEGYYLIASDSVLPFCTVVEVSNHTISGSGITPGVPFKALVIDRGGAINGSKFDLFIGSQSDPQISLGSSRTADVRIVSLNSRYKSGGLWNCSV